MSEEPPFDAAAELLGPLLDRLERAADLASQMDATAHFIRIAQLCREAVIIAEAGALLTGDQPPR